MAGAAEINLLHRLEVPRIHDQRRTLLQPGMHRGCMVATRTVASFASDSGNDIFNWPAGGYVYSMATETSARFARLNLPSGCPAGGIGIRTSASREIPDGRLRRSDVEARNRLEIAEVGLVEGVVVLRRQIHLADLAGPKRPNQRFGDNVDPVCRLNVAP